MSIGPNPIKDNLVFGVDLYFDNRNRRVFRGKPTTNFYSNTDFTDGLGSDEEGGSNATNTIVKMRNPGKSSHVLKQTMGVASTEYQINLTSELSASTTYCLSGWYAESDDYSGSERMFHCRAYSTGGSHVSLGVGLYNVLHSEVVNGVTWRFCYATITTPSDYSNNFNWYVGYSSDSYSGARFYTDLQMEEGSYPTWYIDGATRSNTTTLKNYAKSNYIDISGVDFDSTNKPSFSSGIINSGIFSGRNPSTDPFTVEAVIKSHVTSGSRIWVDSQGNGTNQRFYSALIDSSTASIGIQGSAWSDSVPSHTNWSHQVIVMDGSTAKAYADGVYKFQKSYTSYTLPNSIVFGGRSGYYWDGEIAVARIYERALNESEISRNFNAYRKRFSI